MGTEEKTETEDEDKNSINENEDIMKSNIQTKNKFLKGNILNNNSYFNNTQGKFNKTDIISDNKNSNLNSVEEMTLSKEEAKIQAEAEDQIESENETKEMTEEHTGAVSFLQCS